MHTHKCISATPLQISFILTYAMLDFLKNSCKAGLGYNKLLLQLFYCWCHQGKVVVVVVVNVYLQSASLKPPLM